MIALPMQPETPNVRALANYTREEFTGLTTTLVTVAHEIVVVPAQSTGTGIEQVVKNGSVVRPSTYTVSGKVITLGSALIAGDWVVVSYWARAGQP